MHGCFVTEEICSIRYGTERERKSVSQAWFRYSRWRFNNGARFTLDKEEGIAL
jgi:hypothetical protein